MILSRSRFCLFIIFFVLLPTFAQALDNDLIPSDLKPWIPWVLHNQEKSSCTPELGSGNHLCSWPTRLILDVNNQGGVFTQTWEIETRSLVPLPGNVPYWPDQVTDNDQQALVSKINNHPAIWLTPGTHTISGKFRWQRLPEHLLVPPATGFVQLILSGKSMSNPRIDQEGRVWFQQKNLQQSADENSVSLQIFRKINDGVPLTQELVLLATVSGSPRPLTLGLKLDKQFVPLNVSSPLPLRLDNDNKLNLQVRPGQWQIRLTLRNTASHSPEQLSMGDIDGLWPDEEIWVVQQDTKLRQLDIQGVAAVDPSRTALPKEWKSLPAYLIKKGMNMVLVEKSRGTPSPTPNRLTLHRRIWLDEQGSGLTIADSISGTMTRGWRLNVARQLSLGRVEVDGTPQLITRLPDTEQTGVEVRQGKLALQAVSRVESPVTGARLRIPAVGWDHSIQQLSAELNLPPGWSLLTATGIDKVSTWLNRWTLLDLFLVLIISLATARVLGWGWGSVALLTLALSYHQPGAPRFIWLPLLALLGMHKVITAKTGEKIFRLSSLGILLVLIISSVPYMIHEIRVGIYPQLELGRYQRIVKQYRETDDKALTDVLTEQMPQSSSPAKRKTSRVTARLGSYSGQISAKVKDPVPLQVDPQDMIQTGPGLPEWSWKTITLHWNGPVTPEQQITFFLLSPAMNMALAIFRVLLLFLLLGGFLKRCLHNASGAKLSSPLSTALLFLVLFSTINPLALHAEIPSPELLNQLQERLLEPPKCGTHCAQINSCIIRANDRQLQVELGVDVQSQTALPLPGKNRFFQTILVNSKPADNLRLNREGFPLLRLPRGNHRIVMQKRINKKGTLSFVFPEIPSQGQAVLQGWSLNGLRDNGLMEKQLTLRPLTQATEQPDGMGADANDIEIPPFVQIERTLHMGLKWNVNTRIIRRSPGTVIALNIPILPGEHVTTESMQVNDRHIRINMGTEQSVIRFSSSMEPVNKLALKAANTSSWSEIWFLDVSPIWHVATTGIPAINQTNPAGKRFPEYHPYPVESLQLHITRPKGIDGPVMTINKSHLSVQPGLHATENTLSFSLTASRGMQHAITLPPEIDLQKILIDDNEYPLQLEDRKLIIPIRPGKQRIEISWRSKQGIKNKFTSATVNLGMDSVNTSTKVEIPSSRWILLTGGPRIGPAVLFWGVLLILILIALLLGRITFTPLSFLQWLLLSLGLSQIPVPLAATVVSWLILLGLRKDKGLPQKNPTLFNLAQVALILLTLAALGSLFLAIQQGLLGHPDMQIAGNGSTAHTLRWYQDRTGSILPEATIYSVPLFAYRICMLLWALWLAMALLNWLRWGWDCFSDGGIWKKNTSNKKKRQGNRRKEAVAPIEIE